jgi:signal transduction histidine kinase/ActR/RegA family two-component response regulator
MWKRMSVYLFKNPDEIGLDNYLVLIICFFIAVIGILGTLVNIVLNLGIVPVLSTAFATTIFSLVYLFCRIKGKYFFSKYALIIASLILLDIQWFINFGSYGPILYLYVIIESLVIIFFKKNEKIIFSIVVFLNVSVLFFIEYRYPMSVGKYSSLEARLFDIYTGMLIYLFLSIILLNIAIKFYISQKEKATIADKLKSVFLANMSHEIRTPMNGILGFAELLKEPNLTGHQQKEYIDIIEKSGERMLNIINDIIDISKIESGLMMVDLKNSNINKQVEYVYTLFKNEVDAKGLSLSFKNSLPSNEAFVKTDPEKLYAILINLVKNAIKYTHKGSIDFGYNIIRHNEESEIEFYVKDTGIGINKDRHKAIFERFVQADIKDTHAYQGAGLGLSISKAYVEMLSGNIRVESEQGIGTVFYFTIPYIKEINNEAPEKNGYLTKQDTKINNLKILIAEDDTISEMLISKEVRKFCRELLFVNSGRAAVETCLNNPDIDLILMDIKMPNMDGYEATREIRKFNKRVIIIAQTAFALSGDRAKAIEAGCNDYISKPINNSELKTMIMEHFKSLSHTDI